MASQKWHGKHQGRAVSGQSRTLLPIWRLTNKSLLMYLAPLPQKDAATPTLDTFIAQGNQFNTLEVSRRKAKTIQEVLAEFNDAHSQVISLMTKISPEMLRKDGTLPWYGMEYALDDVLVYMYYGHKREHSAQIAAFRDQMR